MRADFTQARDYALDRLASELSAHLTYHSLHHTRDDVLPAALRLAAAGGVTDEDTLCLATAAAYHDTGFLYSYAEHEAHGIALARAVLPGFSYNTNQIDTIAALIAATKMPQRPATRPQRCSLRTDGLGSRPDSRLLPSERLPHVRPE